MIRNTHALVESQFPEYIRGDERYSKFLEFLVEYYKTIPNISVTEQRDIDETSFIDKFISEQAANFKELSSLSPSKQRLIVTKLGELYRAKGSVESYKALFNILYDIDIEVIIPAERIFKPSAAKWNRDVSVRFKLDTGLLSSFENVTGNIITKDDNVEVYIIKISKVDNAPGIFEAFLSLDYKLRLPNGGRLVTSSFTANLVKSINSKFVK